MAGHEETEFGWNDERFRTEDAGQLLAARRQTAEELRGLVAISGGALLNEPGIGDFGHALDRHVAPLNCIFTDGFKQAPCELISPLLRSCTQCGAALRGAFLHGLEQSELQIYIIGKFPTGKRREFVRLPNGNVAGRVAEVATEHFLVFSVSLNVSQQECTGFW
ncbi:MAG: hypothetical protein HY298_24030 [Verrucomicrobia bacterium]|nr:hypothetical protein [Verrucomicrobiota bacterium]